MGHWAIKLLELLGFLKLKHARLLGAAPQDQRVRIAILRPEWLRGTVGAYKGKHKVICWIFLVLFIVFLRFLWFVIGLKLLIDI